MRNEAEVLADREQLNRLMGLGGGPSWKISQILPELPTAEPSVEELEPLALAQRLDLAATRQEVKVFEQALVLARRGAVPAVSVGVDTERDSDRTRVTGPSFAMGHDIPNVIGVSQEGVEEEVQALLPGYMAMGEKGMHEHLEHSKHMEGPENTLPMMGGDGPFGPIGMGGMFTVLKVHEDIPDFKTVEEYNKQVKLPGDFGWYNNPPGTVADLAPGYENQLIKEGTVYTCPMHLEVKQDKPGSCPKCGMTLKPENKKEK